MILAGRRPRRRRARRSRPPRSPPTKPGEKVTLTVLHDGEQETGRGHPRQAPGLRAPAASTPLSPPGRVELRPCFRKSPSARSPSPTTPTSSARRLTERIRELAEPLKGKRVLHVSATAFGGGVSEILYTIVPLMRDVGLDAHWHVIFGKEEFFNATKLLHNSLQGAEETLSDEQWELFDEINADQRRGPARASGTRSSSTTRSRSACAAAPRRRAATGSGAATSTSRPRTRRRSRACCR